VEIGTFTGGGFGENAYLAACAPSGACVAIDPGADAPRMIAAIQDAGLDLEAIVLTHAHLDHVEGVHVVRAAWPDVPIWLHPEALPMYRGVARQAASFGMRVPEQPEPTHELRPGERFSFGDCDLDVRYAPGHAPGHVVLVAVDESVAFVGDVVFRGSIGRSDLPGGDHGTLMASIRDAVLTLPDDTVLYSGHGPPTTVGVERRTNPFLVAYSRGGPA
jgi:glyoxylase-like metal-dependent hydrolase (beta-lactamase superfamily II)